MHVTTKIPLDSTASKSVTVTRELTVAHFHSHMPEVYGTPMMIYLMEVAAAAAIDNYLPAGWVSVGFAVDVRHFSPTPVGLTVTATAKVLSVSDKKIRLSVEAEDGIEKIGEGTHVRVPVQLERLEQRIRSKSGSSSK